jgi:hypothetical protein
MYNVNSCATVRTCLVNKRKQSLSRASTFKHSLRPCGNTGCRRLSLEFQAANGGAQAVTYTGTAQNKGPIAAVNCAAGVAWSRVLAGAPSLMKRRQVQQVLS